MNTSDLVTAEFTAFKMCVDILLYINLEKSLEDDCVGLKHRQFFTDNFYILEIKLLITKIYSHSLHISRFLMCNRSLIHQFFMAHIGKHLNVHPLNKVKQHWE